MINWHSSMVFLVVWNGAAGIASRNFRSSTKTSSGHLSPQLFPGIETKTTELRITNPFLMRKEVNMYRIQVTRKDDGPKENAENDFILIHTSI